MRMPSGFAVINVEEHHDAAIGWLPSPLIMAALIVSPHRRGPTCGPAPCSGRCTIRSDSPRTSRSSTSRAGDGSASCSGRDTGRRNITRSTGAGPIVARAPSFVIETLLAAWRGDPIEYRGRIVHVSPRPYTVPHPRFYVGGMSAAAVKRAARFGLPYFPAQPSTELEALYLSELARLGNAGFIERHDDLSLLIIDDGSGQRMGGARTLPASRDRRSTHAGRAPGSRAGTNRWRIRSPHCARRRSTRSSRRRPACARAAERGEYRPILHPLAGGIPVERAWRSLRLFVERVLGPSKA